ncbi:MAG TPA: pilus assembly protein TadG-related protein, partial [Patescibacteria group bacterium]|nr:pilus assembly protein TadG-related protein [Patescibacteria group bacterium]
MNKPNRREAGQVLVLFAGAFITLILVAALVIDLGFVFMLMRHEQNAADPGAIAAARYISATPNTAKMWDAACFYALQNDFKPTRTDNGSACDPGGASDGSTITMNYPPSVNAGEFAGEPRYVEVTISSPHNSFFAGIAGKQTITVATNAVAANDDGSGGSSSLVALNPTACSAGQVHGGGGGGGIYIFPATGVPPDSGGYVQVNSNCGTGLPNSSNDVCDPMSQGAFTLNGGATIQGPALYVQGACDANGASGDFNVTSLDEGGGFVGDPLSLIRAPKPTDLPTQPCPGASGPPSSATNPRKCNLDGTVTLNPGTYYGGWSIGNGVIVTLNPGIYVIAGGGITETGGVLDSATGRVMIFSTDASPTWKDQCIAGAGTAAACQNSLSMTGRTNLRLQGLDRVSACPPYSTTGCPYGGMLMWQDGKGSAAALGGNRCDVSLSGSGDLYITGTIYAKCGLVTITGNGTGSGCDLLAPDQNCAGVQIISDTWDVGG